MKDNLRRALHRGAWMALVFFLVGCVLDYARIVPSRPYHEAVVTAMMFGLLWGGLDFLAGVLRPQKRPPVVK